MAKNIKEKKEDNNKIDIKSLLIGLLSATVIGLLIFIFSGEVDITKDKTTDSVSESLEDAVADSYKPVEMDKEDIEYAKKMIGNVFELIRTQNGFLNVITGEEEDQYDSYYYNKDGEIFAIGNEDNYCNVYRKDEKAIIFTDYVYEDYAIDTVTLIDNALKAVNVVDGVTMIQYVSDMLDISDEVGIYDITIESWEGIRALYEPVSEEFADDMVETMKSSLTEDWDPYFKFRINVTKDGLFAAQCVIKVENTIYTQWAVDGYALLYDWDLPDEWYDIDLADGEKAEEMLTSLMEDISNMVGKYMEENPDMLITDDDDEVVTDNGDGTHTHSDGTVHDNLEHEETAEQGSKKEESTENTDDSTVSWEGTVDLDESNTVTREEAEEKLEAAGNSTEETVEDTEN